MSAAALRDALAPLGIDAEVEEQGKVALIRAAVAPRFDAAFRRRVVALARAHGFSNVAIELDAGLPGD